MSTKGALSLLVGSRCTYADRRKGIWVLCRLQTAPSIKGKYILLTSIGLMYYRALTTTRANISPEIGLKLVRNLGLAALLNALKEHPLLISFL